MHMPAHIEVALLANLPLYPVYSAVIEFEYPATFQAFHMVMMRVPERMFITDMPIFGKRCPYQACLNKMWESPVDGPFCELRPRIPLANAQKQVIDIEMPVLAIYFLDDHMSFTGESYPVFDAILFKSRFGLHHCCRFRKLHPEFCLPATALHSQLNHTNLDSQA